MYRIADFNVNIRYMYPENKEFFADYEVFGDEKEDFFVASTDKEIENELKACLELDPPQRHSPMYAERLVILRKLCELLIGYDTFLLHGVVIEYEGKGYVFTAPSGTGKTTHALLWKEAFGEKARIINGDKPLIRLIDGEFYAYGTPWCGKEGFNINGRVKIDRIGFLKRAKENSVEQIDETDALCAIMRQIDVRGTRDLGRLLDLVGKLFEECTSYTLCCNMDVSAATVACNGMK